MAPTPISPYVRIVSGKGSLTIPDRFSKAVRIFLYVDVVRENASVYRSYRTNPSESFFGRVTANIGNYVLQTYSIDFDRQVFEVFNGANANIIRAIKCLEKAVRNYEVLGSPGETIPFLDQLAEFEPERWDVDNFKFVCFGGTALRLELKGYVPSDCGEDDSEPTPPPPPPQDEPFDKLPPDEPIEVTPPEPGKEDDTDPFEGDEEDDGFPVGERCEVYECTATMNFTDRPPVTRTSLFFGEIEAFYVNEDESGGQRAAIIIRAYGIPLPEGDDVCNSFATDYIFIQAPELGIYESADISPPIPV